MNKVSIVKCDEGKIFESVERSIELIVPPEFTEQDTVVIKPNLCDLKSPESGVTTNPKVVEAVIKYIQKRTNAEIIIAESDHWLATADEEFEELGYVELAEKYGVKLVNLSKDKKTDILADGKYFDTFRAPETLLRATKIISIPKIKTHAQYKMTCVMKNQFGLIPNRYKARYHPYMNEVLFDLNRLFRLSLCIVDGVNGLEGPGPSDGFSRKLGVIICGKHSVATDAVAAKIIGFKPRSIPYIKYAEKHGLGSTEEIEILGDNLNTNSFTFMPYLAYMLYRTSLKFMRIGDSLERTSDNLANLASMAAAGLIVLKQGFIVHPVFGTLTMLHGKRYLKGLLKRLLIKIRLKIS